MRIMQALPLSDMIGMGIQGIFYVLALVFVIQALFLGFHWINYGEDKKVAVTALAVFLMGGAALLITIASTLYFV